MHTPHDAPARHLPGLTQETEAALKRIDAEIAQRIAEYAALSDDYPVTRECPNPTYPLCKHFTWDHDTNQVRTDLESLEFMLGRLRDARKALIGSL